MNNKIRAVLLTVLTYGVLIGLAYGMIHYAHFIGMLFMFGVLCFASYLLYTMFKSTLDYRDKNKK